MPPTDAPAYYRCTFCAASRSITRVMSGAAWPVQCGVCGHIAWEPIPKPENVRECPYCNRCYPAALGTCPWCEDA
jgi:hypothetical protein